jgi:hypothetical protein
MVLSATKASNLFSPVLFITFTDNYIRFIKTPKGPTLVFKVLKYSLIRDVQKAQTNPASN